MSFLDKLRMDAVSVEVMLRMGLCSFCGYALSVAYLPSLVPQDMAYMVGLFGSIISVKVPTLMFSIGAVLPIFIVLIVMALIWTSMLLACVAVSDGLFVAIYAVFCFWMSSLHFGEKKGSTAGNCSVWCSLGGMMAVSYRPLVKEFGLSMVGDLWTEQGLDNGLADHRNMLICLCWGIAGMVVTILVPPFRTARSLVSRSLLPVVLMRLHNALSSADEKKDRDFLLHMYITIARGTLTKITIFEPRLTRCSALTEDLVAPLVELCSKIDNLLLHAFGLELIYADIKNDQVKIVMADTLQVIQLCSKALASNDYNDISMLRNWNGTVDASNLLQSNQEKDGNVEDEKGALIAGSMHQYAVEVREATLAWMDALDKPEAAPTWTEGVKRIVKYTAPWVMLPLTTPARLAVSLSLLLRPSRWNLKSIMYGLKLTFGFTALICMEIYWEEYASYQMPTTGVSGPVFSGWNLLGYAFAWRPTLEGTTKKGLQRVIGTAFGGFAAWLGVIVCSGSYDEFAEINPYGLCAWLTVTTALAGIYLAVDAGEMARMGCGYDHGYIGLYFVLTHALLALEIYSGVGSKHALVSNRIVATITGVALAVVVSSLPPFVRGGDPKHTGKYLKAVDAGFFLLLKTFASADSCNEVATDDFHAKITNDALQKGENTLYFLKDAGTLRVLPIYRVSEKLKPLVESIAATQSAIECLHHSMADLVKAKAPELEAAQRAIQDILPSLECEMQDKESPNNINEAGQPSVKVSGILLMAEKISIGLRDHSIALNDVEFKPKFLMWY